MPGWMKRGLYWLIALGAVIFLVLFMRGQLRETDVEAERFVQRVRLVEPPPPPPPRKIEAPPPEPEIRRDVKIAHPDPADNADDRQVMDDRLGVDAAGDGSGDAFGLVAKRGGKDLLATAKIAGGGDAQGFGYYASQIERILERVLAKNMHLRQGSYSVIVRLWVSPVGRLERFDLTRSSGDPIIDARLKEALIALDYLGPPPPQNMPQPVRLRVLARAAG